MRNTFRYSLFLFLLLSLHLSAQKGASMPLEVSPKNFFKKANLPVYTLQEVLNASKPVRALSIQESDLIPTSYGELCLLDSLLDYNRQAFLEKVQLVERLYLQRTLPKRLVQLLAQVTSINTVLLQPSKHTYSPRELQQIESLQAFKELRYLEGADTSLAFIQCLQNFQALDTLVWLDVYLQNRYFEQLTNVSTLIIHKYPDVYVYNPWSRPRQLIFNFPKQLTSIYTKDLYHFILFRHLQNCTNLKYVRDASGVIIPPKLNSLKLKLGDFPPPIPDLKELTFEQSPNFIPANINAFLSLNYLHLPKNGEHLLPASFYQLSNLEYLHIGVAFIGDSIRYLQRLKELYLYLPKDAPNAISDSIQYLQQLQQLRIHSKTRKAPALPNSIYQLSNLKTLELYAYTISDSIRYLSNLQALSLNQNIPDSLGQLSQLRNLDILEGNFAKYPNQIYALKNLEVLRLSDMFYNNKAPIRIQKLKQLKKLRNIEFSLRSIRSEWHYRALYQAVPENCQVQVHEFWNVNTPASKFNVGLYMDYGWGQAAFTGMEFLYFFDKKYQSSFTKKKGRFQRAATTSNPDAYSNPFHFHTLSTGVEWNYLPADNFMMGYRIGYNYSRIREPISFELDLIAYTNYSSVFDLRLAPRIAVTPVRTSFMYVYVYYSYKIPLLANQEQQLVARHSIGLGLRVMLDWSDIGFSYGF